MVASGTPVQADPHNSATLPEEVHNRDQAHHGVTLSRKGSTNRDAAVDITKRLIAGGIAGAVAKTVIAPLDRTKIIFQTSEKKFSARNVVHEIMVIVNKEGFTGLWRGNMATVLRVFPYAGIQFAAFDVYKRALKGGDGSLSSLGRLLAGSAAGATAVSITYPLDLLRARLAVRRSWDKQSSSLAWWDAVTGGTGKISIKELYRGLNPTLLGILPYAGIAFLTRDSLNSVAAKHYHTSTLQTPLVAKMASGAVAGLVAQSTTYPLDLVRRRMQTEGFVETGKLAKEAAEMKEKMGVTGRSTKLVYTSIWGTLNLIYEREGVKGLFKGLSMNWIKGPVAFMISFTAFDYLKLYFNIQGQERQSEGRLTTGAPAHSAQHSPVQT
mmetsp:Transcript_60314/g.142099  ORF Transcript_60314/g.142099 Transcript_60314/m.142099 type:complete len:382 (-) Transcript_60314:67-1212(-)